VGGRGPRWAARGVRPRPAACGPGPRRAAPARGGESRRSPACGRRPVDGLRSPACGRPAAAASGAGYAPGMRPSTSRSAGRRGSLAALAGLLALVLRPAACLACDRPQAWPCCAACLPPEPAGAGPWRLAADPGLALWTLGPYRGALREAMLAGKLRAQPAALTVLGRRLGAAMAAAGVGADLVTWIPAAPAGGLLRDHARRVAAGVAAALDLPAVGLLAPAPGRDLGRDRGAGLAATRPAPRARRRLAGGRVLVVDDVATTGATLAGAAAALRHAGARQVEAAVLAAATAAFGPAPAGEASPHPARAGEVPHPWARAGEGPHPRARAGGPGPPPGPGGEGRDRHPTGPGSA